MTEDKRRALRLVFLLDTDVKIGKEERNTKAQMIDISRYGLKLLIGGQKIPEGTDLEVKIRLPQSQAPAVLRGRCIRCDGASGNWIVGVALDPNEKNALNKNQVLESAYQTWKNKQTNKT